MKNSKGFIAPVVLIILGVFAVAGTAFYIGRSSSINKIEVDDFIKESSSTQPEKVNIEKENKNSENLDKTTVRADNNISTENWNTYMDGACGYSFRFPDTWVQYGNDSTSVNIKGEIFSRDSALVDIASKDVETHDGNNNQISSKKDLLNFKCIIKGGEFYNINLAEFNKSSSIFSQTKKEIVVGGQKAIVGDMKYTDTVSTNHPGRNIIPYHRIYVYFMHKDGVKSFYFEFETPLLANDQKEIDTFYKLLDTFKFN